MDSQNTSGGESVSVDCSSKETVLSLKVLTCIYSYRSLSIEQEVVYAIIDEGGSDGAWTKTIKARSGLHEAVYKTAIKQLEAKAMIQDMKSVEHPTRKMYIKSSVRQSDKSTGGPWFSNNELDDAFIEAMARVMYMYILGKSYYRGSAPKQAKKVISGSGGKKMTSEEVKAARNNALGPVASQTEASAYELRQRELQRYLPMPAGYAGYPDLQELTLHIENASYTDQTLSEAEVKQILDLLMFDDKIEAIPAGSTRDGQDRFVYKALRHSLVDEADRGTLANEVPCGRCPVFALCEEGGPVAPSNCEYFTEWLSM